jgi:hypothetical protein
MLSGRLRMVTRFLDGAMLRTVISRVLVLTALLLVVTPHGAVLLGSAQLMLVVALVVMGVWQAYRLSTIRRGQQHGDLLKRIPKRPLGL